MENTGTPSQHENESYSDYMSRLYKAPPPNVREFKRDSLGRIIEQGNPQRPNWTVRPPHDLAKKALKFMREQNMSVTKYLTYAMHNLHNNQKDA
jgi:hypothetical protein